MRLNIKLAALIYDAALWFYFSAIRTASIFNEKAKQWTDGRRSLAIKLTAELQAKKKPGQQLIWMHCASLGEFEQGRPIIEKIKTERPDIFVLLTFFSPSGYEVRKNYPHADLVTYLPADSRKNADLFLKIIDADLAIFVKYEFWFHYLHGLRLRQIPTFLIAATFRSSQPFFKWWGNLHREMLACFTKIMVQDAPSANLLAGAGFANVAIAGDPRIDRVLAVSAAPKHLPEVKKFCGTSPILVCGSTWGEDEKCIRPLLHDARFAGWKIIIAPHDVSEKRLAEIEYLFSKDLMVRYSEMMENQSVPAVRILLIDNIGMLSSLYQFGKIAFIGGGFSSGIHNILEPMAFGLPVFFGPKYQKFNEAKKAVREGFGYSVNGGEEFLKKALPFLKQNEYVRARNAASDFMYENKGATNKISQSLTKYFA